MWGQGPICHHLTLHNGSRQDVALHCCLLSGRPIKIGFVGGSCTEGSGMYANMLYNAWPTRLTSMLKAIFNSSNITMRNGATGATGTAYMALCELPLA